MIWWLIILGGAAALLLTKATRRVLLSTFAAIRGYVRDVTDEMKKVSWPSKTELKSSTGLVIFSMLLLSLFIGIVDLLLTLILGLVVR